jgi:aryl-alcohol dehydrogenase-like predicted oxidoreductase
MIIYPYGSLTMPQGLSVYYAGAPPRQDALKVLDYAADSGCTFWDTSDVYGDNEDLIGEWYAIPRSIVNLHILISQYRFKKSGRRDEIFLATKFGFRTNESKMEVIGTAE